jgi:hypothetical protein
MGRARRTLGIYRRSSRASEIARFSSFGPRLSVVDAAVKDLAGTKRGVPVGFEVLW